MFIPTVAPPMDKKANKPDILQQLNKWLAGDLFSISKSGHAHNKTVMAFSDVEWAKFPRGTLTWVPEGTRLLYLGEFGQIATHKTQYYVKCLYNGGVYWVETSRLRLIPRGSKNLVHK